MKRLQELVLASVVTLVLATTTFAGEIPTGGKTPPPPPPSSTAGENAIDPSDTQSDEYQLLEEIVPDLLLVMLSVF